MHDFKIKHVVTSNGDFTDAWADGKQSRFIGHLTVFEVISVLDRLRACMKP